MTVDCHEVQERLNELVDLELPERERVLLRAHLENCARCAATHRTLVNLKKLLHAKVRRPPAPAGLAHVVVRKLTKASGNRRSLLPWAAAAAIVVALGSFLAFSPSYRDAHAETVKDCLEAFRDALADPLQPSGIPLEAEEAILADIKAKTGMRLESLPPIQNARYCRTVAYPFKGGRGARIDFCCDSCGELVSVFALRLDQLNYSPLMLPELARGHWCECVGLDDSTVFCLSSGDCIFNIVTRLRRENFERLLAK